MEQTTTDKIEDLIKEAWACLGKNDMASANKLAELVGKLSISSWYLGMEMAQAELEEVNEAVKSLNTLSLDGKKITNAESEKLALKATDNRYGKLKAYQESLKEIVNALKQKINVISWEYNSKNNQP